MSDHRRGQVAATAAQIYEEFFVPALFEQWPVYLLSAAGVVPGERVLDVACGTGVLARAAAEVVGEQGEVVGLDINPGMLEVARSSSRSVVWRQGAAEELPFSPGAFDRVLSQFALMFFRDREAAIAEMLRVCRPGGRVVVAVWGTLEQTPGYAAVAELLRELFGEEVAQALEAPYCLGDVGALQDLLRRAGASVLEVRTLAGKARFESIDSWIYTDIRGWTLAEVIDAVSFEKLRQEAPSRLRSFENADGTVEFEAPAHVAVLRC